MKYFCKIRFRHLFLRIEQYNVNWYILNLAVKYEFI